VGSSEHDDGNFGLHKKQAMRLSKNTLLAVTTADLTQNTQHCYKPYFHNLPVRRLAT